MTFNSLPTPSIFGHRGASAHAPENTLAAFELAREQGADGIELDVKLSADGIPVVIHDETVDRTTDGKGTVADLGLAALKELDAGEGQRIPTLNEVFESVAQDLFINVELTNYSTPEDKLVEKVVELIKKHKLEEKILFSSFLPKNLRRAAEILPETARGLLTMNNFGGWILRTFSFRRGNYQALHPPRQNASKKQIKSVQRIGRRVYTWTVNAPDEMRRLADWGIDGIITDDPALAVKTLRKN
ncbi:MAG: glycerophosphodiester phosphodiesterase [Chloroflexi bacterium]|nr:glycerophosphodiester phosphodiesterase [Chloroflexota bacterium]